MSELSVQQLADLTIAVNQKQLLVKELDGKIDVAEHRSAFLNEDNNRLEQAIGQKNQLISDKEKDLIELDKKYVGMQSEFRREQEQKFKETEEKRIEVEQKLWTLELRSLEIEGREKKLADAITAADKQAQSIHLVGQQNAEETARIAGIRFTLEEEKNALAEAQRLLDFVDLKSKGDMLARNLPYGAQRRLEIARALATKPKLLLLDEPSAGMNPQKLTTYLPCM